MLSCGLAVPLQNLLRRQVAVLSKLPPVEEPHDVITPPTTSPVIEQISLVSKISADSLLKLWTI
jgi:hypothetical protein